MSTELERVLESIADLKTDIKDLKTEFSDLKTHVDNSSEKFDTYRQANQQVTNLAFGLIASATIITIAGNIFHR